jgi:hypothetical protein
MEAIFISNLKEITPLVLVQLHMTAALNDYKISLPQKRTASRPIFFFEYFYNLFIFIYIINIVPRWWYLLGITEYTTLFVTLFYLRLC